LRGKLFIQFRPYNFEKCQIHEYINDVFDDDDYCDSDDDNNELTESDVNGDAPTSYLLLELRKWVAEFNISLRAVRALLSLLQIAYNDNTLPKDPRTVMRSPRSVKVIKFNNNETAEYWHQGLEMCLRNGFNNLSDDKTISINVNIDGLPLFVHINNFNCTIGFYIALL
jgi:hypothetical protein